MRMNQSSFVANQYLDTVTPGWRLPAKRTVVLKHTPSWWNVLVAMITFRRVYL